MYTFQFQYPIMKTIDAEDYEKAVIKYIKLHREHNIERFGFIDHMNNYRNAFVKYMNEYGKNKIRVSFQPYNNMIGYYNYGNNNTTAVNAYPTMTPNGIVPSVNINARGLGPNSMLIPMM